LERLVVSEESGQKWSIQDWDRAGFVDIVVSPGLGPVVVKVFSKSWSSESFFGGEDGGSYSFSLSFVKSENSSWLSFFWIILWEFTFGGEILNDGSHEDIVIVSLEVNWDLSLVSSVSVISWEEIFLLNEIVIGVRVRR
jgi:hypothetical protein